MWRHLTDTGGLIACCQVSVQRCPKRSLMSSQGPGGDTTNGSRKEEAEEQGGTQQLHGGKKEQVWGFIFWGVVRRRQQLRHFRVPCIIFLIIFFPKTTSTRTLPPLCAQLAPARCPPPCGKAQKQAQIGQKPTQNALTHVWKRPFRHGHVILKQTYYYYFYYYCRRRRHLSQMLLAKQCVSDYPLRGLGFCHLGHGAGEARRGIPVDVPEHEHVQHLQDFHPAEPFVRREVCDTEKEAGGSRCCSTRRRRHLVNQSVIYRARSVFASAVVDVAQKKKKDRINQAPHPSLVKKA